MKLMFGGLDIEKSLKSEAANKFIQILKEKKGIRLGRWCKIQASTKYSKEISSLVKAWVERLKILTVLSFC